MSEFLIINYIVPFIIILCEIILILLTVGLNEPDSIAENTIVVGFGPCILYHILIPVLIGKYHKPRISSVIHSAAICTAVYVRHLI